MARFPLPRLPFGKTSAESVAEFLNPLTDNLYSAMFPDKVVVDRFEKPAEHTHGVPVSLRADRFSLEPGHAYILITPGWDDFTTLHMNGPYESEHGLVAVRIRLEHLSYEKVASTMIKKGSLDAKLADIDRETGGWLDEQFQDAAERGVRPQYSFSCFGTNTYESLSIPGTTGVVNPHRIITSGIVAAQRQMVLAEPEYAPRLVFD